MATLEREDLKLALKSNHIRRFDQQNVRAIIADINKRLQVLEVTHGIKVSFGRCTFTFYSFKMTMSGSVMSTDSGQSPEKITWDRNCANFNLLPADFGKRITFDTGKFSGLSATICGINSRARYNKIMVKLDNGQGNVRCHPADIKIMLGR